MIAIVGAIFLFAYFFEKALCTKKGEPYAAITTQKITIIGLFSAVSGVLMLLEIPLPFAPVFYKLDLSEVPVLILAFAYGPFAGELCELLKILIKLLLKGTSSAFVGELANFLIGSSLVMVAGIIYLINKTKMQARIACILGTVSMTIVGALLNAYFLLPTFAQIYGMPLDQIVAMGTAINPSINTVSSLVLMCVVPLNLLKGCIDSFITILLYRRLRPIIKKQARS